MNRITRSMCIALAFALSACATAPGGRQADEHAAHQHDASAASSPNSAHQPDASMAHMHANMQRMQEMMAKIHATKDPAERQRLMAEHRAAMRSHMQAMGGMMGHGTMDEGSCSMMGSTSGGRGMARGGMMGGDSAQHQCQMMGHMQMMHGMMQQMMEHMSAEHGDQPDGKPAAPDQKQQEHVP